MIRDKNLVQTSYFKDGLYIFYLVVPEVLKSWFLNCCYEKAYYVIPADFPVRRLWRHKGNQSWYSHKWFQKATGEHNFLRHFSYCAAVFSNLFMLQLGASENPSMTVLAASEILFNQ